MANHNSSEDNSVLGIVFAVIGITAAGVMASDSNLSNWGSLVLVLIMAVIGYKVGKAVELIAFRVLFIIASIILFLVNVAIRRFIWEVLKAIVSD